MASDIDPVDPFARQRIDNYIERRDSRSHYPDTIHGLDNDAELNLSDLRDVLAAADRDHRFAEAVRAQVALYATGKSSLYTVGVAALDAEADIYGTPCTATAKEGTNA